jgi:hypothetical protein
MAEAVDGAARQLVHQCTGLQETWIKVMRMLSTIRTHG